MGNYLITDIMIELEAKRIFKSLNIKEELKFNSQYNPNADAVVNTFYCKDIRGEFKDVSADRTMSLDDYVERIIKPILYKMADKLGYATWD